MLPFLELKSHQALVMNQGYNRASPFHQSRSRRGRGGASRGRQRQPFTQQPTTAKQQKQQKQQETQRLKNDFADFRYADIQLPQRKRIPNDHTKMW